MRNDSDASQVAVLKIAVSHNIMTCHTIRDPLLGNGYRNIGIQFLALYSKLN